jgi:hypothetical protein
MGVGRPSPAARSSPSISGRSCMQPEPASFDRRYIGDATSSSADWVFHPGYRVRVERPVRSLSANIVHLADGLASRPHSFVEANSYPPGPMNDRHPQSLSGKRTAHECKAGNPQIARMTPPSGRSDAFASNALSARPRTNPRPVQSSRFHNCRNTDVRGPQPAALRCRIRAAAGRSCTACVPTE